MKFISNISNKELNIWGEIGLDILVSLYFFPKAFNLIQDGNAHELVPVINLIVNVVVIAVVYSIIVFGAIALISKEEEKDERDKTYELRGYKVGYFIIQFGILVLIGILYFNPMNYPRLGELSLPVIAVVLYGTLVIGSLGKSLTLLRYYRWGV